MVECGVLCSKILIERCKVSIWCCDVYMKNIVVMFGQSDEPTGGGGNVLYPYKLRQGAHCNSQQRIEPENCGGHVLVHVSIQRVLGNEGVRRYELVHQHPQEPQEYAQV